MKARHDGVTMIEILISIALSGVIAMLLIPKFLSTDSKVQNVVVKAEAITQLIASSITLYESSTGEQANPASLTYDRLFYEYGNYFAYKQVDDYQATAGPPPDDFYTKYYLLANGSRLSFAYLNEVGNPTGYELYTVGVGGPNLDSFTHYDLDPSDGTADPVVDAEQWNAGKAAATYCGDFNPEECFYVDLNGSKKPNRIGPQGDIIPFRIDPSTDTIRTLYQWQRDAGMTEAGGLCQFLSSYDVESGVDIGTCPTSQIAWDTDHLCPTGGSCL